MTRSSLILQLVSIVACMHGCHGQSPERISLTIRTDGLPALRAVVSDSVEGAFILDTGAGIHVLSSSMLCRSGGKPDGVFTGFRHTGERIDLQCYRIGSLSVGRIRQDSPSVTVWPILDSLGIDGIISLKLFEHYPFTLDVRKSALIIESVSSLNTIVSSSTTIPVRVDDIRGRSMDVFADAFIADSIRLECILDTGSPGTIVNARYLGVLGIDTLSDQTKRRVRPGLFGGSYTEYTATIEKIELSKQENVAMEHIQTLFKRNMIYDGLIGMNFFMNRAITFDLPGKRMLVGSL